MTDVGGRFDTGTEWLWRPLGTFHWGQNVAAGQHTIVTVAPSTFGNWVRVDYASVNLDFSPLDLTAMGQLVLELADSTYVPFLSVTARVDSGVADVPTYGLAFSEQLSLPFVLGFAAHIAIRGQAGGLNDSTIAGTVSLSGAYGPPPGL